MIGDDRDARLPADAATGFPGSRQAGSRYQKGDFAVTFSE
jgi:hypothetical protein